MVWSDFQHHLQFQITIMVYLGILHQHAGKPYQDEATNRLYELLFCDDIEYYSSTLADKTKHPWELLISPSTDEQLFELINDDHTESRIKILAYHQLRKLSDSNNLLGVIIEVSLPEGLDVLAAYSDGTARYINYTGKVIIWETQTKESTELIHALFAASQNVVSQIGAWDGERLPYPKQGNARLTFLVRNQLYFGEGGIGVLSQDPTGGSVLNEGAKLMEYLIHHTLNAPL